MILHPQRILQGSNIREKNTEAQKNAGKPSRYLTELSLFVKDQVDKVGPTKPTTEDFSCAYCGQISYHSTRCPLNPYEETRCGIPYFKAQFLGNTVVKVPVQRRSSFLDCNGSV